MLIIDAAAAMLTLSKACGLPEIIQRRWKPTIGCCQASITNEALHIVCSYSVKRMTVKLLNAVFPPAAVQSVDALTSSIFQMMIDQPPPLVLLVSSVVNTNEQKQQQQPAPLHLSTQH